MSDYEGYDSVVRSFLPPNAEIMELQHPGKQPAILVADVDGDHEPEITAVYRVAGELSMMILKQTGHNWYRIHEMRGKGIGISDLWAAPIVRPNQLNIIVGWQTEWNVAELDIYQWSPRGFHSIIPEGTLYSRIEVEDMPGPLGRDGVCELAIWSHDCGDAYRVETYRWQPYGLVQASDVNPYYFQKVAYYYEALTLESPDEPVYREYLEEARTKAQPLNNDNRR